MVQPGKIIGNSSKKQIIFMKYMLAFILIISLILPSCEGPMYKENDHVVKKDTVFVTYVLEYGIPNKDREPFGGSPDVWAAGIPVTDSLGITRVWLLTDAELKRLNERADKNQNDR